jgi:hypothetical protein
MRRLVLYTTCAMFVATSAGAQQLSATGVASGEITIGGFTLPTPAGASKLDVNGEGGSVEAIVSIKPNTVSFESGTATSGGFASSTSYSGVDVTLTNNTGHLLSIEQFGSTIVPAGLGFYVQDRSGGDATGDNIFQGFPQAELGTVSFADFTPTGGSDEPFAFSDFEFTITSGEQTLYSLSGSLGLVLNGEGKVIPIYNLTAAELALDGFVTAYDNELALAYAWDSTDILVNLGVSLEQGDSRLIKYRTRVTRAACITPTTCLVAYSGFGDPIGRGGGISALSFASFDVAASDVDITGIVFDPVEFQPFRLLDGGGNAVPEPTTWAVLVLGLGLLGAALRRREPAHRRL